METAADFLQHGVNMKSLHFALSGLLPEITYEQYNNDLFGSGREQDLQGFFNSSDSSWVFSQADGRSS